MTELLPLDIVQLNSCCSGRARWNKLSGAESIWILNISAAGASLVHITVWKTIKVLQIEWHGVWLFFFFYILFSCGCPTLARGPGTIFFALSFLVFVDSNALPLSCLFSKVSSHSSLSLLIWKMLQFLHHLCWTRCIIIYHEYSCIFICSTGSQLSLGLVDVQENSEA